MCGSVTVYLLYNTLTRIVYYINCVLIKLTLSINQLLKKINMKTLCCATMVTVLICYTAIHVLARTSINIL